MNAMKKESFTRLNEAPRTRSSRFLLENASFQVSFFRGLKDHGFSLAENNLKLFSFFPDKHEQLTEKVTLLL